MAEMIKIKYSKKRGYGMFASKDIPKGTVFYSNIIEIPKKDLKSFLKVKLSEYCFEWKNTLAICTSDFNFLNHSYTPNLKYSNVYSKNKIKFVAIKRINKGDELTINYNGDILCMDKLWFDVR